MTSTATKSSRAPAPEVSSDRNEGEGIQDQCSRARCKTLMVERAGDGWSSENGHATRTRTPDRRYQPGRYTGGGVFGGISHFKITDSIYRIGNIQECTCSYLPYLRMSVFGKHRVQHLPPFLSRIGPRCFALVKTVLAPHRILL